MLINYLLKNLSYILPLTSLQWCIWKTNLTEQCKRKLSHREKRERLHWHTALNNSLFQTATTGLVSRWKLHKWFSNTLPNCPCRLRTGQQGHFLKAFSQYLWGPDSIRPEFFMQSVSPLQRRKGRRCYRWQQRGELGSVLTHHQHKHTNTKSGAERG